MLEKAFEGEDELCTPKEWMALRKSRGVPGRREARWGTYMTLVRYVGMPGFEGAGNQPLAASE